MPIPNNQGENTVDYLCELYKDIEHIRMNLWKQIEVKAYYSENVSEVIEKYSRKPEGLPSG